MARSRRRTPITGMTTAESDKRFKLRSTAASARL